MSAESKSKGVWAPFLHGPDNEIDDYELELKRHLSGQVSEKVFLEYRLRRGVYGQRQPGVQMLRIKIPLGRLTTEQMTTVADLSEEYSDGIAHVTTRQDFQLHFVNILHTPQMFRRLADVGITTREACGNVIRNVTCCPDAGVCPGEVFDVSPYAVALTRFMLRHPDAQSFGRKFKIAFSGCTGNDCGLARIHDIGAIARQRTENANTMRGFEFYVGGGLGAVPHQARLFDEFLPAEELLPITQAIARVFARLGEKKSRARARMKFLVAHMGIERFRDAVREERTRLPDDPRRHALMRDIESYQEQPLKEGSALDLESADLTDEFRRWYGANVRSQRQEGYSTVTVFLPLGDLTADQLRGLARVSRRYVKDTIRATVEQNFLLRWVGNGDLPELHRDLQALQLALPIGGTIGDVTACPGTDTCKLGIASSRGLAGTLHRSFLKQALSAGCGGANGGSGLRDDVRIKISGCFNSCGQHHVANIGFFGSSKRKGGRVAPVFQVILGGATRNNADSYGLVVAKVAAHGAPEAVRRLTTLYDREKRPQESFNECMARLGKARVRQELASLGEIADADEFYRDNRQPWEYVKKVAAGECAGELVPQAEFMLDDAERLIFDASLHLEAKRNREAARVSFEAMKAAANGLLSTDGLLLSDNYDPVVEFRRRYLETGNFFPGCADYFFKAAGEPDAELTHERSRQRVEEANLFVEEAHVAYSRMAGQVVK